jgi:hypothetical protein
LTAAVYRAANWHDAVALLRWIAPQVCTSIPQAKSGESRLGGLPMLLGYLQKNNRSQ